MMSPKAASEPILTVQIGLDPIDIQGLRNASLDVREAIATPLSKPPSIPLESILSISSQLPQIYQTDFAFPAIGHLMMPQKQRPSYAIEKLQEDATFCLIELCEPQDSTGAVQRMVNDLFFRVHKGSKELPTLFTWSHGSKGLYVWNSKFLEKFSIKASLATMPQAHASRGILAWTSLAHEVSSHYLLKTYPQVVEEMKAVVGDNTELPFATYWKEKGAQLVSDTLGVLNLGPAGAIGLLGYLQALAPRGRLSAEKGLSGALPGLLRGLFIAHVIENLRLTNAKNWSKEIQGEVLNHYPKKEAAYSEIPVGDTQGSFVQVNEAIKILAATLCHSKLDTLRGQTLVQVRSWNDDDEVSVQKLRETIRERAVFRQSYIAEHIIGAVTLEFVRKEKASIDLFKVMVGLLEKIHSFEPPHNS